MGELLFPLGGPDAREERSMKEIREGHPEQHCPQWCRAPPPHSLVITPHKRRAAFWHNHEVIEPRSAGRLWKSAMNADCAVLEGEKWIASFPIFLRAAEDNRTERVEL